MASQAIISDMTSAKRNKKFTNWSNTYSCSPELYFEPVNESDLRQVFEMAQGLRKHVRFVGCGHSPSDIMCSEEYLVSLKNLNSIIEMRKDLNQISVEAGISVVELNNALERNGMALSVLGSISDISLGGAISTSTHGTGMKFGTISDSVMDLDLMTVEGKIFRCSENENSDIFHAALCGLGCLGAIIRVTMQCEEKFYLTQMVYPLSLTDVVNNLDAHLAASDHFRVCWYPHTGGGVTCHHVLRWRPRVQGSPPPKPSLLAALWGCLVGAWSKLVGYYLLEFLLFLSLYVAWLVPVINRVYYRNFWGRRVKETSISYKIFNFDCLFSQYVNEWAVPLAQTGVVLMQLQQLLENEESVRDGFGHAPVEIRFVKATNRAWLSPSYGEGIFCYINIIAYRPYGLQVKYQRYWDRYEQIMMAAGGRPHWAKAHRVTASEFTSMYAKFGKFCALRKRLDPRDTFVNAYMRRILP